MHGPCDFAAPPDMEPARYFFGSSFGTNGSGLP